VFSVLFGDTRSWCLFLFDGEETRRHFTSVRLVISLWRCRVFLQTDLCNVGYGRNIKSDCWIIFKYGQYIFCVYLLSYGWVEFASCTWVSILLFRSVVLSFVDLGGGGEWHDACCSVLTCITVNWSGELV